MALHVSIAEVQSWLDAGKLSLAANDPLPEEQNAATMVLARLTPVYPDNVPTWINTATTPLIVRVVISALTASYRYNKIYSEEEDSGNRYASKLEGRALELLSMLVNGDLAITEVPTIVTFDPLFWPDDTTGALIIYDALGNQIGVEGSEDIRFTMGARF
jgi:hypothetical protein